MNGCGDSSDGGVDSISLVFDFDALPVNEDRNDGVIVGDDNDFDGEGV